MNRTGLKHYLWMELGKSAVGVDLLGAYARMRGKGIVSVSNSTKLVIEGYPRSANTFALAKISTLNPALQLAHHVHGAGQLIKAINYGTPALVLIRYPVDAVASLIIRERHVSVDYALKNYNYFYRFVIKKYTHFYIADFLDVINDFDVIVEGLMAKYPGLALNEGDYANLDVSEEIKEMDMRDNDNRGIDDNRISMPVNQREDIKNNLVEVIGNCKSRYLQQSIEVYTQILELLKKGTPSA